MRESERERKRVVGHGRIEGRRLTRAGDDDIVAGDSWEKTLEKTATPPAFLLPADTMSRRISFPVLPFLPSFLILCGALLPVGIINLAHPPSRAAEENYGQ